MTHQYDLIIFGATSFVGQILCKYPDNRSQRSNRYYLGNCGPLTGKMEVLKILGLQALEIPIIQANASDEASLKQMCQQAKVVVSTVGPYALYGEPLVKACVESGTDYCDLTGEAQWIEK